MLLKLQTCFLIRTLFRKFQFPNSPLFSSGAPQHPDVLLVGGGMNLLYHSGLRAPPTNTPTNRSAPFEPHYWVLPSGAGVDRFKLMVALNGLEGIYIRASYGTDPDAQAR